MRSKKFKFKKRALNTRLWGIICILLLVIALFYFMGSGVALPLQAMAILSLVALYFGNRADKRSHGYFYVDDDELVIKNHRSIRRILLAHINDASIVDPGAARRYIHQRIEEADNILSSKKRINLFIQFSSVEIGYGGYPPWLLGLLQGDINKRSDLVLLRLQDDTDLLLSPSHEQDAVSYINKAILSRNGENDETRTAI